jgi:molybdopterin converting factor small subunit
MLVRVKLMASLRSKLPPGISGGIAPLEMESGATIARVLEKLAIPGGHVHLIMVNGAMETDRQRPLAEGDEMLVFPPVAGG